jgi:signal transduction histidine kinase
MLEGFDKTWSPLSRNTNANFGKLSEGSYTFRVKALNLYGLWSEMSYSFKVLPPWYRTWWAYAIYVLLFLGALRVFSKWRERRLRDEKEQLQHKVEERTSELKQSLENLKSTQSQLIQSEKMASLGELTAGIAHEIQNPLNFVNNFSEVNSELIAEMKQEIDKGNLQEVKSIADSIDENEQKIISHGKRADAIVKGMLQHSRSSSGVKEPTDINALCDEYLRLSYHGLRAKDKSFNATMKTDFDESIGNINIIPQDIGRVVLNLINNAFYVVDEKKKQQPDGYEPTVSVSTKKVGDKILIAVKDNGNGIPQKVLDKIFQPFFTTKPTGQGTGLGLSLSYDIVKAHGGELKVDTKEGEGTTFIIRLPF